jgi:hypothetical protein
LKKLRFNPSNKALLVGFKRVLDKWIQNGTLEDNGVGVILLDIHYKYDKVESMVGLLDVIDKEFCTSFFMDDTIRTIAIICMIHSTKDILTIWKGVD